MSATRSDTPDAPNPAPTGLGGPPERSLLDRRLVVVTGKGGVGKTTISAALARGAAGRGRRVLCVELGLDAELPERVGPGVDCLLLDPHEALAEYLSLQIGMKGLLRRVLGHRGFRQLLEGAPGWRELISVGKVWQLVERADPERGPDFVVVDAPATGHGLTFLDVPRVAAQAVHSGPLHRHAGWVEALLRDPERTFLLPVARPEELPALECVELVTRLRGERGLPMDRIILNGAETAPEVPIASVIEALERSTLRETFPWRAALEQLGARAGGTATYGALLARECELPLVSLPYAPELSASILDAMGAVLVTHPPAAPLA